MNFVKNFDRVNLIFGMAGFLLLLGAGGETTYAIVCSGYTNGYRTSAIVPCNNASCVSLSSLPAPNPDPCQNGTLYLCDDINRNAVAYSATTAPSWVRCTYASSNTYPACNDSCLTCMNLFFFDSNVCSKAWQCTVNAVPWKACGNGTQ